MKSLIARAAWAALVLIFGVNACGETDPADPDSETHWVECATAADCIDLDIGDECVGGICRTSSSSGTGGASAGVSPGDAGSTLDGSPDATTGCPSFVATDAGSPCTLNLCSTTGGYEIRVTRADGWYVGALVWVLSVCTDSYALSRYPGGDTQTLAYSITESEFAALPKDANVYVYYGAPMQEPSGPRIDDCGTLQMRLSLPEPIGVCVD